MKKLLALLLVMLLTFSLAACGNGNNTDPSDSDNPGASQTENQGGESTDGSEENDDVGTIYDIEGEFSAKQIAFIESLGKSEDGYRCCLKKDGTYMVVNYYDYECMIEVGFSDMVENLSY